MLKRKEHGYWRFIFRGVLIVCSLFALFSLAYYITKYMYLWLGHPPSQYLIQMTTLGIAIVLILITGLIVGRFSAPRQHAFWQSILDVIRQVAKGNFNVQIDVDEMGGPGEFRQLVHSINDMAKELAQVEDMRREFVSNVSHEIQSPLTAILGFVEALKRAELTEADRQHYLNIIETESKRMSRLSENLLKLTSLESGVHPFHPGTFRLDRQIREVVLSIEPLWLKRDIQIELSLQSTSVLADKDLLSQVWINLLSNAIKFTRAGGVVSVSLEARDGWTVIAVKDSGIGIHAEDQQRIFERFFKADTSRQRGEGGSGLGLTIVKKIVDIHQGEIYVSGQEGVGATFTVRLPNAQIKLPSRSRSY